LLDMLRRSLVVLALCATAAPAIADTTLTVVAKKPSWSAAPTKPVIKVQRQPDGITLSVRWGGSVCEATWTVDGTTVHAELNVDAPAHRSCTVTLALAPWPADSVDVAIEHATPRHLTVPKS
jgi:hypothetical protein